MESVAV